MSGRITKGPNQLGLNDLFYSSFVTTALDGLPALAVVNPDGSEISGGGGGSNVNLNQVGGAAIALGQTTSSGSIPVVIASDQPIGGGTQYTDGSSTITHPIGTIPVFNNAGTIAAVSVANPLPVSATFSGSITSSPTFAQNPGAGTPTAAYGLIDTSFRPIIVGAGTAGTSTGGVLSVQGVSGGTTLPVISGNATGSAVPTSAYLIGVRDGSGNLQPLSAANNTGDGGGASSVASAGVIYNGSTWDRTRTANSAATTSGTGLLGVGNLGWDGTNWQKLKVDGSANLNVNLQTALPAGTNAIGSITNTAFIANAGTNLNTSALALESGGNLAAIKIDTDKIPSQGQALAAASMPVVLTAAQITTLTPPAAITGFSTSVNQTNASQKTQIVDGSGNVIASTSNALNVSATITGGSIANTSFAATQTTAANLNATVVGTGTFVTQSTLAAETTKVIGVVRNADGSGNLLTSTAGSLNVVQQAATGTLTNVASSATSVVILASNANRKAATVYNDSTQILYLKFGTTASTTSFTAPLAAATYYEVPGGYTGEIDGIWASANGNARVTEIT